MNTTLIIIGTLILISLNKGLKFSFRGRLLFEITIKKTIEYAITHHYIKQLYRSEYVLIGEDLEIARKVKSEYYSRWMIFNVYYKYTELTYAGKIYPKGYDYRNDTEEGVKAKQDLMDSYL